MVVLVTISPVLVSHMGSSEIKSARPPAATPTPSPAPAALVGGAKATSAFGPPSHSPDRLDFNDVWDGESALKTFYLTIPAAGYVRAEIPSGPFFVTEIRELGSPTAGGSKNAPGPQPVITQPTIGKVSFPEGRPGPWTYGAGAGNQVLIHVVFKPKFDLGTMLAGPKSATMKVSGPGVRGDWTVLVPLHGTFNGKKLGIYVRVDENPMEVVDPATGFDVPLTLVGIDHPVSGRFRLTSTLAGITFPGKDFTVPAGQTVKASLHFTLVSFWHGRSHNPGGTVQIAFEYEGRSSTVSLDVKPYPGEIQLFLTTVVAGERPGCDTQSTDGQVTVRSNGEVSLAFWWKIPGWTSDPSKSMYLQALFNGRVFAEGFYPQTTQSVYYAKGLASPSLFRTSFRPQDYLPMARVAYDGFTFTCNMVSSSTHF